MKYSINPKNTRVRHDQWLQMPDELNVGAFAVDNNRPVASMKLTVASDVVMVDV